MPGSASRFGQFVDELRRRRVFRVAAFYGGIAFVIVQIIDGTFEVMGIPAWVSRLLITLLAIGFPIAIGLAWVFDITSEGIVRTEGRPTGKPLTGNGALIAVAIAAVAFGIWGRWGGEPSSAASDLGAIRSIVVLPLDNNMGDPDQDYFVDGMTEALTHQLSKFPGLKVISRTSAIRYKNSSKTVPEIAAELGVDAVVEGSVFKAANKVRITAQLIDGRSDAHLWSSEYERSLEDIMSLHRDVARAIAKEIDLILSPEAEARLSEARPVNPEAFDLYIRGRHKWNKRTGDDLLEAQRLFKAALDIDPAYALAHSALAESYPLLPQYAGMDEERGYALGRAAAQQAIKFDPTLAQPYAALGLMAEEVDSAAYYFDKAIALNPNYGTTYHWYALQVYAAIGDTANARAAFLKAADLDPLSTIIQANLAYFNAFYAEQYSLMLERAEQLLLLSPNLRVAQAAKGLALLMLERPDEAEPWLRVGARTDSDWLFYRAFLAAQRGDFARVKSAVIEMRFSREALNSSFPFPFPPLVLIWDMVGQPDSALAEIDLWAAGRDPARFGELYISPIIKKLRLDPCFEEILDRHRREWARTHGGL